MSAADLHDRLGEAIGMTQALRVVVRHLSAQLEPEIGLAQLLVRLNSDIEEMQRRCDSLVASHTEIKQSRITATAREVKARVAAQPPATLPPSELLSVLVVAAKDVVAKWRALEALMSYRHDPPVTSLVRAAILVHTDHVHELARHAS